MSSSTRRRHPAGQDEVYAITTARRPQRLDVHDRMVKYTVSMGLRMVCIVLAFVVQGWLMWVFVAGAVVLPYIAVLVANAGREQTPPTPDALTRARERHQLGGSRPTAPGSAPR